MEMVKIDNAEVRILLVDDTPANQDIAGNMLGKEGYDLYVADSGFSALEQVGKNNFDLILLDIMMPEMDGFETYIKIKQHKNYENVPVIFLSADGEIDSIVRGFELGGVDYICKPFNAMELKARVGTHVELKKIRKELEDKNKNLQEAYKCLDVTATTDALTKLLNRREMLKRMEYERLKYERNKRPFSIVAADIDFFKKVNDTYGHDSGDYILKAVAKIMLNSTRKTDSVSRWGGEEFLLALPETDAPGAARLAEKIRTTIEESVFFHGKDKIRITVTFGICEANGNRNLDEIVSKADYALYQGKAKGRNCVVVFGD